MKDSTISVTATAFSGFAEGDVVKMDNARWTRHLVERIDNATSMQLRHTFDWSRIIYDFGYCLAAVLIGGFGGFILRLLVDAT